MPEEGSCAETWQCEHSGDLTTANASMFFVLRRSWQEKPGAPEQESNIRVPVIECITEKLPKTGPFFAGSR